MDIAGEGRSLAQLKWVMFAHVEDSLHRQWVVCRTVLERKKKTARVDRMMVLDPQRFDGPQVCLLQSLHTQYFHSVPIGPYTNVMNY